MRFDGVGAPTASHPDVGFCSQFAVFKRTNSGGVRKKRSGGKKLKYELITVIEYPYKSLKDALEELLNATVMFMWQRSFHLPLEQPQGCGEERRTRVPSRTFGDSLLSSYPGFTVYKKKPSCPRFTQFEEATAGGSGDDDELMAELAAQEAALLDAGGRELSLKLLMLTAEMVAFVE